MIACPPYAQSEAQRIVGCSRMASDETAAESPRRPVDWGRGLLLRTVQPEPDDVGLDGSDLRRSEPIDPPSLRSTVSDLSRGEFAGPSGPCPWRANIMIPSPLWGNFTGEIWTPRSRGNFVLEFWGAASFECNRGRFGLGRTRAKARG
jgi:hypothetical protein